MNQRDEAHVLSLYYEKKSYEITLRKSRCDYRRSTGHRIGYLPEIRFGRS